MLKFNFIFKVQKRGDLGCSTFSVQEEFDYMTTFRINSLFEFVLLVTIEHRIYSESVHRNHCTAQI